MVLEKKEYGFAHFDENEGWIYIQRESDPVHLKSGMKVEINFTISLKTIEAILQGNTNDLHGLFLVQGEKKEVLSPGTPIRISK